MKKTAAKPKTTSSAESGLEQLIDVSATQMAKTQILTSLLSMGWRLAVALLVPIIIGVKIDQHFGTKPSYALAGFVLAVALASYVIYTEFQEIQANQKRNDKAAEQAKTAVRSRNKKGSA